jgi:dihydroorotate dehydrogenase
MYELIVAKLSQPKARTLARASMRLAAMVLASEAPTALRLTVMGLTFPGPVGLAAGFDKHGTLYPSLPPLGFGFAEIGSVIPLPELRRSHGLDAVTAILSRYPRPHPIPLGVSISMNRKTPSGRMVEDYLACLRGSWKYADYIALNLGGRTGPDLHLPEYRGTLRGVLAAAKNEQARMVREHGLHRPMVVKVDQTRGYTNALLDCVREFSFDGLILGGDARKGEESVVLASLERVVKTLGMPIISVGGIRTPQDVSDRLAAGAALVQLYSGLVQSGPLSLQRMNYHLVTGVRTERMDRR